MRFTKKAEPIAIVRHLLFFICFVLLRFTLKNAEPVGLAFLYAVCLCNFPPFLPSLTYFLSSLFFANAWTILVYGLQSVVMCTAFIIRAHLRKKGARLEWLSPLLALAVCLVLFSVLAPFSVYPLPFYFFADALTQKVVISCAIFLLSAVFSVAMRALTRKLLKCRLTSSELLFCSLFFTVLGVGICQFLGFNAYTGIALYILLLFAYVVKNAGALVCAFLLSLPTFLVYGVSIQLFFVYGTVALFFSRLGKLSLSLSILCVFFVAGYFDGLYTLPTGALVARVLSAVLPALAFVLTPAPFIREIETRLVFYREKHLSRIAINRNRNAVGEQLYELSAVFREIQTTFSALGNTEAEESAKAYIRTNAFSQACKNCPQKQTCKQNGVLNALSTLIDVGCMKGKVSLIDLPKIISDYCINQSNLLYAVNARIADYKKYMLEAENAQSGRTLLARQAQGVSEILRNLALEQSEPLRIYTDKEQAFSVALQNVGIICSEVLVYGEEDNPTLSLITFGLADVKKIAEVASHLFGKPMSISKRLTLGNDKFCCILRAKPRYDAAFGVATRKKSGETASGDTHSVIKIDERKFMVALSDGMGSGEYAKRVSESTISLLESFYRAKMPSETILTTVNKLLSFSKEETFACVDIAVVDLDSGYADIVKIGSPVGFILSGNTVKVLENGTLPLGILDSLHPTSATYELLENDILLFLSDGIKGAFGSTTDLYNAVKSVPVHNPQQLADGLLSLAVNAYGGQAKDDMTALAVRLFKAS